MADNEIRFLHQEHMDDLFYALKKDGNKRNIAMFHIAYFCGLRASEIGMIQHGDFNPGNNSIFIHRLKKSDSKAVHLDPDRLKVLKSFLNEKKYFSDNDPIFQSQRRMPISRYRVRELFIRYAKIAKIPKTKRFPHILKHSIAVHLLDSGADIEDVRQHLGHKNIKNTLIYAKYTSHRKRRFLQIVTNSRFICR